MTTIIALILWNESVVVIDVLLIVVVNGQLLVAAQ